MPPPPLGGSGDLVQRGGVHGQGEEQGLSLLLQDHRREQAVQVSSILIIIVFLKSGKRRSSSVKIFDVHTRKVS